MDNVTKQQVQLHIILLICMILFLVGGGYVGYQLLSKMTTTTDTAIHDDDALCTHDQCIAYHVDGIVAHTPTHITYALTRNDTHVVELTQTYEQVNHTPLAYEHRDVYVYPQNDVMVMELIDNTTNP